MKFHAICIVIYYNYIRKCELKMSSIINKIIWIFIAHSHVGYSKTVWLIKVYAVCKLRFEHLAMSSCLKLVLFAIWCTRIFSRWVLLDLVYWLERLLVQCIYYMKWTMKQSPLALACMWVHDKIKIIYCALQSSCNAVSQGCFVIWMITLIHFRRILLIDKSVWMHLEQLTFVINKLASFLPAHLIYFPILKNCRARVPSLYWGRPISLCLWHEWPLPVTWLCCGATQTKGACHQHNGWPIYNW